MVVTAPPPTQNTCKAVVFAHRRPHCLMSTADSSDAVIMGKNTYLLPVEMLMSPGKSNSVSMGR